MKRIIFILCCLWHVCVVYGQDSARIFVKVRVQKEAVLLRWAVSTPLAWKQTNRSGFRLERYTVVRDGELLEKPEKVVLGDGIIKAKPLEAWLPFLESNDNAGIIAQALYGEDFQLTGEDAQGFARIVNLAQELEQRFTFSLYAADQDFEMACMAGWGWRDMTVKKGERYLYRVVPEDNAHLLSGSVYTSLEEFRRLPRPLGLEGIWNDGAVMLSWNYDALSGFYNSYYIEKSTDGKVFRRLAGRPVSNLNDGDRTTSGRIVYLDSLADNSQVYYYRVRGINTFGEIGPPSDTISGHGIRVLPYVPVIRRAAVDEEGFLDVVWEFDSLGNELIEGFELRRSDKAEGRYETVMKGIKPGVRGLKYDGLESSNYFVIAAVPFEGEVRMSYPVLVQPLDTVPPATPQGLAGSIDSLGNAVLVWKRNGESDLLGYKVLRANLRGEEPYALTDRVWTDTVYTDRVELDNLNRSVFYYVVALDKRYNHSPLSGCLELRKPDVIPPLSPLIDGYQVTPQGIEIHWVASPDEDVAEHQLFRRKAGRDTADVLIASFPGNAADRYVDTAVEADGRYTYSVFAVDSGALRSLPTPSVTVYASRIKFGTAVIDRFDAVVDKVNLLVKLTWSANLSGVKSYEIYRSENALPMTLWKILPGWQQEVTDTDIAVGMKYEYMLRALFEKGGNSQIKRLVIQ